jgi:UDP-N-acetyl-D-galactosamine dehydrogenase
MTHKAESIGFHPQMILAGRRINDGMASYIANDVIKTMLKRKQSIDRARVLVMGFTFKELRTRHAQHKGRRSRPHPGRFRG